MDLLSRLAPLALALSLTLSAAAPAGPIPPPPNEISPADRAALESGAKSLADQIAELQKLLRNKPQLLALLPDVQIYHKAVDWPLKYKELIDVKKAKAALAEGAARAAQLKSGQSPWLSTGGIRAYVSKIDGSIQPYNLIVPKDFNPRAKGPYRLDFFFHGRGEKLMELEFISSKGSDSPMNPPDEKRFVVFPYGRYCNANKFAGEIDTLELIDAISKQYPIDANRILIGGFSMGGAACWHHAVHYTDLFAAATPGAGFVDTRTYLKMDEAGIWEPLPWYQKRLMHLYDCPDWALNLSMLPTVAYSGEIDKQKQAADAMFKAMENLGLKLEHIIGPNTAHKYEPAAKAQVAKRLDQIAAAGRNTVPEKIRFITWTLRYNHMHWITVEGLHRHFAPGQVEASFDKAAKSISITTSGVTALSVQFPKGKSPFPPGAKPAISIDGAAVPAPAIAPDQSLAAHYVKSSSGWAPAPARPSAELAKRHGLQGPIDDAFLDPFIIVTPTGQPLNAKTAQWTDHELKYATDEWRKIFRGEARVKADKQLSETDIASHNLVLFGDPSSNAVLAKISSRLPIQWTPKSIALNGQTYSAGDHALILIYPNPLNPAKYVVLNSGFTFRQNDHRTNSLQLAKLPDYAVIDLSQPPDDTTPGKIAAAGFFDERWQLQKDHGQLTK